MIDRRAVVLGSVCLAAAASAEALRPKQHLNLLGRASLEDITPRTFGSWSQVQTGTIVQPREEGTLAAQLYSQVLARVYNDASSGDYVMLAVAYGDTQSDLLQLHRPETCYPAFGFALSAFQRTDVNLAEAVKVPARSLVAKAPGRIENVTYWTRIGQYLPGSQTEQRRDKLKTAIAGHIPDGMLVRCSTIGERTERDLAVNSRFLNQLILAIAPGHWPAFIGTALAETLAATVAK
jgi:EpsI family protein